MPAAGRTASAPPMRARAVLAIAVLALVVAVVSVSIHRVEAAGGVTQASWHLSDTQAGTGPTEYLVAFTTTGGPIKTVAFTVSGTGLGGSPAISVAYGVGRGSVARVGQVITYAVDDAVPVPSGTPVLLGVGGLTNPAAGVYSAMVASRTAGGLVMEQAQTPPVTLTAGSPTKSMVVEPSLMFQVETTPIARTIDPAVPALADLSYATTITVLTNAESGYTLSVCDHGLDGSSTPTGLHQVSSNVEGAVAWPAARANVSGFTVTGTGVGDPGFSVAPAFAGGTKFGGSRAATDIVARSTTSTSATANRIIITVRAVVDRTMPASQFTESLDYSVTPNYT